MGKVIAGAIGTALQQSGVFDCLVDKGETPDPEAVYIYNHGEAWDHRKPFMDQIVTVRRGSLVHKLQQGVGYTFEFVDAPGVVYHCNFPWAFVLDTPRNRFLFAYYLERQRSVKAELASMDALLRSITLQTKEKRDPTRG